MKYSKKRASAQVAAPSIKYVGLNVGEKVTFNDIVTGELDGTNGQKVVNDVIMAKKADGTQCKVPVREFLKMGIQGQGTHYKSEDNNDDVNMPNGFTVVSKEDRKSRDGKTVVYPAASYKLADAFFKGEVDYNGLVEGGLKEDNTFAPIQNYTIEIH